MQTPYRAVSFDKHDIVLRSTLDQLQANNQWTKENTPRMRIYRQGEDLETLGVIICGRRHIAKNKKRDMEKVAVHFGGRVFAPQCRPHITTGVNVDFQKKIFCVVNGPKGITYPTADGFEITVNVAADKNKNDVIKKGFFVHWHAFGYRTEGMNDI